MNKFPTRPEAPEITQKLYDKTPKNTINGLYRVGNEWLKIDIQGKSLFSPFSYIFFKNGLPHNENGPAVVSDWKCYFLVDGQVIKNKPFSFHNYSYKDYPYEILLDEYLIWNGSQFEVDVNKIRSYYFVNNQGELNNYEGPAHYSKAKLDKRNAKEWWQEGQRYTWLSYFYLNGDSVPEKVFWSPEGEFLRKAAEHKEEVLKIIQAA